MKWVSLWTWILLLLLLVPAAAFAQLPLAAEERAGWLLQRSALDIGSLRFPEYRQAEIGGGGGGQTISDGGGFGGGLPMLMSLVLPGAGEAYLGYKRGYLMMALDVAVWFGVKNYHNKGNDLRDEYYAFADAHWSEAKLAGAFDDLYWDEYIAGVGQEWFPEIIDYRDLSLWVSRQDDEREYYENLGKWDQFVFGWDDFRHPDDIDGYDPTGALEDLKQPGVSRNREKYRSLREESNDQFTKRDRLLYLNIAARVFSVFQVAYLQGLFGARGESELTVAGHPVRLITETHGLTETRVAVSVSY